MKKILVISVLIGLLAWPTITLRAQPKEVPETDVMNVLDKIVNWLFSILVVVATISIVIAGYYFVTAAGDPEIVKKARQFVIYAMIGVVVALLARGLVELAQRIVRH